MVARVSRGAQGGRQFSGGCWLQVDPRRVRVRGTLPHRPSVTVARTVTLAGPSKLAWMPTAGRTRTGLGVAGTLNCQ